MANSSPLSNLPIVSFFKNLPDPRTRSGKIVHPLINIVVIALCGTIAGSDDFQAIAEFGRAKQAWLAQFLDLSAGIPSHDTFERLFAMLDPRAFQRCLIEWIKSVHETTKGKVVAIDGKALREAMNRSKDKGPLCIVSAWCSENEMVLAQAAGPEGSNELGALPLVLDLLDLQGVTVTIDAIGCQKEIVEQIVEKEGDYVIAVKGNQPTLETQVHEAFSEAIDQDEMNPDQIHTTTEEAHGRVETRSVIVINAPEEAAQVWPKLKTVVCVIRETEEDGKTTTGTRYFISSREGSARLFAGLIRNHWSIENNLHWQLDMSFQEDRSRARRASMPENLAVLRRVALALIKKAPLKGSIKNKRLLSGWDDETMEKILFGKKVGKV